MVIAQLDSVRDCKEPKFGREAFISHIVSGDVADLLPVAFTKSILTLFTAGHTCNLGAGFEKIIDGVTDEAKVAISDHLLQAFADGPDEFLHLEEDSIVI